MPVNSLFSVTFCLVLAILLPNTTLSFLHLTQPATTYSLFRMSRLLREVKIRVAQGGDVSTVAESAREISQLLATISKDVGNALGCAPASLVAGTLVSVLETVQVSVIYLH